VIALGTDGATGRGRLWSEREFGGVDGLVKGWLLEREK
jgi:hypothetical protein